MNDETFANQRASLLAKTRALRTAVEAVLPLFNAESNAHHHLRAVISNTLRTQDLITKLPTDWEQAGWIIHYHIHEFRSMLGENYKHIAIQLMPKSFPMSEEQIQSLMPLIAQSQALWTLFLHIDDARRLLQNLPIAVYPIEALIHFLHMILQAQPSTHLMMPPDLPAIRYRPAPLFDLLRHICFDLPQIANRTTPEPLIVRFQPCRTTLDLTLTIRGYRLMPDHWNRLHHNYDWDYQNDLGATLEALAWDEGEGQGVIVRLPWAKPPQMGEA